MPQFEDMFARHARTVEAKAIAHAPAGRAAMPAPGGARPAAQAQAGHVPAGHRQQYEAAFDNIMGVLATMPAEGPERLAYKRDHALPALLPYADAYVARGDARPDDIVGRCMVWLFDIGQIEKALELGFCLAERAVPMPRGFQATVPTFLVEQVYNWAAEQLKNDAPAEPYLGMTIGAMEEAAWQLHPIKRGQIYAMAAKHDARSGEWAECLEHIRLAEEANPNAGVKELKKRALSQLQKLPGA